MYTMADLLYLMARLREPETGCPWDLKQDFQSITPSTIEEAYEVVDAIDRQDYGHLKEELGDLVFQAVFYSQLARERSLWQFDDVIHTLTEKLIRRHPHVFPDGTLTSRRNLGETDQVQVKQNWETIKRQERAGKGKHGLLDDVPHALPAINRAEKLQKRAAKVGFDWPDPQGVIAKIHEEINEVQAAMAQGNEAAIADELGDVLFACVNLARHLKVSPEQALRSANHKFERRFTAVENRLSAGGLSLDDATLEEMEAAWVHVKQQESDKV